MGENTCKFKDLTGDEIKLYCCPLMTKIGQWHLIESWRLLLIESELWDVVVAGR
jgi:hypothetical protein